MDSGRVVKLIRVVARSIGIRLGRFDVKLGRGWHQQVDLAYLDKIWHWRARNQRKEDVGGGRQGPRKVAVEWLVCEH